MSLFMDISKLNTNLTFICRNDTRTVRTYKTCLFTFHGAFYFHHVHNRNMFGYTNNKVQFCIDCFQNGICCSRCRYIHNGCVCSCFVNSLFNSIENGNTFHFGSAFFRCHTANYFRTIFKHLFRMEFGCAAGNSLNNHFCVFINIYTHFRPSFLCSLVLAIYFTAETIFSAPSAIDPADVMFNPDSSRIFLPKSTFVPSSLTTSGISSPTCFVASTTPSAMTSHFMMPPKMFTKIPLTFESDKMILKASVTFSAVAPPPTSRKLAGSPPNNLMVSMVAMAKPAPLTKQPILPSSWI